MDYFVELSGETEGWSTYRDNEVVERSKGADHGDGLEDDDVEGGDGEQNSDGGVHPRRVVHPEGETNEQQQQHDGQRETVDNAPALADDADVHNRLCEICCGSLGGGAVVGQLQQGVVSSVAPHRVLVEVICPVVPDEAHRIHHSNLSKRNRFVCKVDDDTVGI